MAVEGRSTGLPSPESLTPLDQQDALPDFLRLLSIQGSMGYFLAQTFVQPLASEGSPRPPNLTIELETLVREAL